MRSFFITTLLVISSSLHANEFEYTLDSATRSYSQGLSVTPTVAYKFSLWGESDSPFEGAIRPKISTEISPATYGGKAELEFAPVTFIKLSVARKLLRRFTDFDDDSCRYNNCIGSLNSTDVGLNALFKFSAIMGSLKFTKSFYDNKDDKSQKLVDPTSYTLISPNKEIANQIEAIVGTSLTDAWFTGVLIQNVDLQKGDGNQNGQYFLLKKQNGHTNYVVGAGRFESELKSAKPSFIFTFKYEWK
jgi:hypothetical protein